MAGPAVAAQPQPAAQVIQTEQQTKAQVSQVVQQLEEVKLDANLQSEYNDFEVKFQQLKKRSDRECNKFGLIAVDNTPIKNSYNVSVRYTGFVKGNIGVDHSQSKMEGFGIEISIAGTYTGMFKDN